MIAAGGMVWPCRLLIVSATLAASLYAGMITVTSIPATGGRSGPNLRSRLHRCFRRPALEDKVASRFRVERSGGLGGFLAKEAVPLNGGKHPRTEPRPPRRLMAP